MTTALTLDQENFTAAAQKAGLNQPRPSLAEPHMLPVGSCERVAFRHASAARYGCLCKGVALKLRCGASDGLLHEISLIRTK